MTDKDEELYQTPCVPLLEDRYGFTPGKGYYKLGPSRTDRQLTMARYAMHKVRLGVYASQMMSGFLTEEQAREEYRKAMENYDQILGLAVTEPDRLTACVKDMEKGFTLNRG